MGMGGVLCVTAVCFFFFLKIWCPGSVCNAEIHKFGHSLPAYPFTIYEF